MEGGGIKDVCQVAVRLLCVVRLSRFSLSMCRRGLQAVLRNLVFTIAECLHNSIKWSVSVKHTLYFVIRRVV